MLHIEEQAQYLDGVLQGCCRGRPSVYLGGCIYRTDWDNDRLFNDKAVGQDEEGEARQDRIRG